MKTAGNEPMEMNQINENTGQDNVFKDDMCYNAIWKMIIADTLKQIVQETNTSYISGIKLIDDETIDDIINMMEYDCKLLENNLLEIINELNLLKFILNDGTIVLTYYFISDELLGKVMWKMLNNPTIIKYI
ncbi:hypothetical protein [Methanobrevibacter ruminantium]|uniref:hypothetical protein n=1 Tax=Methanobrevibacter ruminantium TaxID=83816 RepID=UPI0026ED6F67|nr:hypothetical protein [Methanobrevibacter ruminantium]